MCQVSRLQAVDGDAEDGVGWDVDLGHADGTVGGAIGLEDPVGLGLAKAPDCEGPAAVVESAHGHHLTEPARRSEAVSA